MGDILLETKDLKKYYDVGGHKLHAVDGVNLTIEKGKTLGVVGESGCGKTTLGRTVLGLTPSTSGEIIYSGRDIRRLLSARVRLGLLHLHRTVLRHVHGTLQGA